jgi:hypothetical protein
MLFGDFKNKSFEVLFNLADEDIFTIFRYPYKMIVEIIEASSCLS